MPITANRLMLAINAADEILSLIKTIKQRIPRQTITEGITIANNIIAHNAADSPEAKGVEELRGILSLTYNALYESDIAAEAQEIIIREKENYRLNAKRNSYQTRYRRNRRAISKYYEETAPIAQQFFNDPAPTAPQEVAEPAAAPTPTASPQATPAPSLWHAKGDPNVKRDIPSPEELAKPPASPF